MKVLPNKESTLRFVVARPLRLVYILEAANQHIPGLTLTPRVRL